MSRHPGFWACFRLAALATLVSAAGAVATPLPATETVEQALCRLIEESARSHDIPVEFLTRLIWQESSFRPRVVSPAGAQGIAQFMPGTAQERGLADPFDPEQAIPKAASLLADLTTRFGNLGLAAAAYNGGPARVTGWLAAQRTLPSETRQYVFAITGQSADAWAARRGPEADQTEAPTAPPSSCLQVTALLRRPGNESIAEAPFAPWGVQLAGNFSKERALRSFARARETYAAALGDIQPMIIGTRLRSRGTRAFYRVRAPAATREAANAVCGKIRAAGGVCIVLRS
ncbi:lytic transglycosylase domain-containing protein [Microvirga antarctica]|uniref:lytic transglycosylase domain-containing protein n=1 Tax=Microvirga antarctica TaxID=2819233 RepID=UPI003CCE7630